MSGRGKGRERGFSIGSSGGQPRLTFSASLCASFILIWSASAEYLRWASLGELNTPDYGEQLAWEREDCASIFMAFKGLIEELNTILLPSEVFTVNRDALQL